MATSVISLPHAARFTTWFGKFLRQELAPYPGRGAIVARMVIAATISAVLVVTFRIPNAAVGVLIAFILTRENVVSTALSAFTLVLAFAAGGLFVPIGSRFFASVPEMHFIWEGISLFGIFFLVRTLSNFAFATGLSLVATAALSIWYLPGPPSRNVELTLWLVAAALVGSIVTLAVEIVFHALSRSDEIVDGVNARLEQIETMLHALGSGEAISQENTQKLTQYAVVGMGTLRRSLARRSVEPHYRARMSAMVSLVGRAIDFAAALSTVGSPLPPAEQPIAANIAHEVAGLRQALATKVSPVVPEPMQPSNATTPLLVGLDMVFSVLPSVFASDSSIDPRLEVLESPISSHRIFVEDAFTNHEHLRFALSGTFAAMVCYVLYVSLAWPGISTAVTTCVLTALSNIGTSRQRQVLRIGGAVLGGFVLGMGSQIFILPSLDTVGGFAVLIASGSAIAAWISTSSPRLSYAGLQTAFAFYLINLSEFTIQTSLSIARDRVIGVLLGISMMWLVFEKLHHPDPAADEMVRIFVSNLRQMAELVRITNTGVDATTIVKIRRQRDLIYRQFGDVNAQADAVPFETGPSRAMHMAARDRIRRWQTALRTFYLLETPLIQFRIFGDPHQRERPFAHLQDQFRERCASAMDQMATSLENQLHDQPYKEGTYTSVADLLKEAESTKRAELSDGEIRFLGMSDTLAVILDRLQLEVATEPLYSIPT
jgi:multidrug resistance protein MdtO